LHTAVSAEKKHIAGFPIHKSPTGYTAQRATFSFLLSQNLPNNMGDICMILIQNGRRFITHSPTISTSRMSWFMYRNSIKNGLLYDELGM
jgi:hypothetical protein